MQSITLPPSDASSFRFSDSTSRFLPLRSPPLTAISNTAWAPGATACRSAEITVSWCGLRRRCRRMIGAISTCQVWKYTHGCRLLAVIQYLLQCLIVFVFTNLIVNQSTMYRFLERKKSPW